MSRGLKEYNRKRHFQRTAEPAGKRSAKAGHSFVIQKHQARNLHYDFRLEMDGALKSWAVPKGPSLDPRVKRLAMQVEDHPVAYGSFEGIIPAGEYGGGTVMLWDRGDWEPIGDAKEGYERGHLKFTLHGAKLRGAWVLVRIARGTPEKPQWLLIKERDAEAKPEAKGDVLEELPPSAASGRGLEEIANDRDKVWKSNGVLKSSRQDNDRYGKPAAATARETQKAPAQNAPAKKVPARVDVELATLAKEAPTGDDWLHEIKLDGYRMICRVEKGKATFLSRNYQDWTARFPSLVQAVKELPARQALLDGEVVAVRPDGTTNFQDLQNAFRAGRHEALHYHVFDILHLDGKDLTGLPLDERKRILAKLLGAKGVPATLQYSQHIVGNGPAFFRQVCNKKLEGIVSKRRDRPYVSGRGYDWLKVKCLKNDEFVIGGYTDPAGARTGFGALLVGYYGKADALKHAGKVGTGFGDTALQALTKRLKALATRHSPFTDLTKAGAHVHWVKPELVAQVSYGSWTNDGLLRHASFQGLREDKPATQVTRPAPVSLSEAKRAGEKAATSASRVPSAKRKAVGAAGNASAQEFAGVRLTHPDKILYPKQGITKLDLASYYQTVADRILPYLSDRPLVLVRCPDGSEKGCFYQKHPGAGVPAALRRVPIREKNKTEDYVIVDDLAGLISLAQLGVLEIHAWGSRADKLESPDRLIFDLDPDTRVAWSVVVAAARQMREFLRELGLASFVKTTGGKGLHLVIPIERRHDWDDVKAFCKNVAEAIVAADPARYTANMSKAARPGKIYIDYLRNGRGATAIVPYSTRARPDAPVSVPLTWNELSPRLQSDHFTLRNIDARLKSLKRDPWQAFSSTKQSLKRAMAKLRELR